jgi:xanthine dehydrogenase FAD-binding subunit
MLTCDTYLLPQTLDEAFDALGGNRGNCRVVAGSTDILPWAREGRANDVHIPVLVDITRIPEMTARQRDGERIRLGAATPIQRFLDDPMLVEALPEMPRCAVWFADDQIRESGHHRRQSGQRLAGRRRHAALLAHDAVVELAARRDGEVTRRRVPLSEFVSRPRQDRARGRRTAGVHRLRRAAGLGRGVRKGRPSPLAGDLRRLPAVLVKPDETGTRFAAARVAIGGIGPVPERLGEVEAFLAGKEISADVIAEASQMPVEHVALAQPCRLPARGGARLHGARLTDADSMRTAACPAPGSPWETSDDRSQARAHRQRPQGTADHAAPPAPARFPARRTEPHRHQGRLRRGRMRHLLGVRRRRAGEVLPVPAAKAQGAKSRRSRTWPARAR